MNTQEFKLLFDCKWQKKYTPPISLQMIFFEFGPMNPKDLAAENSKKCQRYGNSIQYSTMLYEKSGQFFPSIQTLLHIYRRRGVIALTQMLSRWQESSKIPLKTQNDTLLDSVYTYFSITEVSTISIHIKTVNFCYILW